MLNVCMVGYGMMGDWHSQALAKTDAVLHTLVGRRAEPARKFAERFGYRRWLLSLDEALADPQIDIVSLATLASNTRSRQFGTWKPGSTRL
jgi:2-hydroxy-4-carboxymuconate semialdehyde hemiacetal dehydrogenase